MRRIGIFVERQRAYGRRICEGVAAFAQEHGGWSLVMLEWEDLLRPDRLCAYDGVIARVFDDEAARAIRNAGCPAVDVYCGRPREGLLQVDQDARAIGALAARHFLERRFVRFAFCGHSQQRYSNARQEAFAAVLAEWGFAVSAYPGRDRSPDAFTRALRNERLVTSVAERRSLARWAASLPKPVGVFCAHDLRAWQLLDACRAAGVRVPEDVAILGVDDDALVCNFTTPTISSIDPNAFGIGSAAARTLAEALEGGARKGGVLAVPPTGLVARNSTKIYPLDPPWLSDALLMIREEVVRGLTAADVFARLGLSHTVVNAAFRRVLDTTVQREIVRVRIETAKRLLNETALPLAEIARRSGYATPQYFCRDFTAAAGVTPMKWRGRGA